MSEDVRTNTPAIRGYRYWGLRVLGWISIPLRFLTAVSVLIALLKLAFPPTPDTSQETKFLHILNHSRMDFFESEVVLIISVVLSIIWLSESWIIIHNLREDKQLIKNELDNHKQKQALLITRLQSDLKDRENKLTTIELERDLLSSLIEDIFSYQKKELLNLDSFRRGSLVDLSVVDFRVLLLDHLIDDLRNILVTQGALGNVRVGVLALINNSNKFELVCHSRMNNYSSSRSSTNLTIDNSAAGRAIKKKNTIRIDDTQKTQEKWWKPGGHRAIWCEPINDKDTPDHVLCITSDREHAFADQHQDLIWIFSTRAAFLNAEFSRLPCEYVI